MTKSGYDRLELMGIKLRAGRVHAIDDVGEPAGQTRVRDGPA